MFLEMLELSQDMFYKPKDTKINFIDPLFMRNNNSRNILTNLS